MASMLFVRPALKSCTVHSVIWTSSRQASVLASTPVRPKDDQTTSSPVCHDLPHIVTPASSPLTVPSNNAFHPAHIPKITKARLTLEELNKALDTSRDLLHQLQSEYLEYQDLKETMLTLTKQQQALLKALGKRSPADDDNESK